MKIIKKLWIRILLSLLFGGFLTELFHLKTGEVLNVLLWIGFAISFSILSMIVWLNKYRYYFLPKEPESENDILDDLD